jgi:hypothetical protein
MSARRLLALALVAASASACLTSSSSTPSSPIRTSSSPLATSSSIPVSESTFVTTPLEPVDAGEPAIAVGRNGTIAVTAGAFSLETMADFGTSIWVGGRGVPLRHLGAIGELDVPDRVAVPSRDSDVEISSAGTLHITTNVRLYPKGTTVTPPGPSPESVISAIRCPRVETSTFDVSDCTTTILGLEPGVHLDRPWLTTEGSNAWIAYYDPDREMIVERSTDAGITWRRAGAFSLEGAPFEVPPGPIVVDPGSGTLYIASTASRPGGSQQEVVVSRSTDGGSTWAPTFVYLDPDGTSLNNIFAALAVDAANGTVHVAWSDRHAVFTSRSTDAGGHWTLPLAISTPPAATTVMPWLAAANGTVAVVYYGTTGSFPEDTRNTWDVYVAKSTDGGATFRQSVVSSAPNHKGVVCLGGTDCPIEHRLLLDLFEVTIDPVDGRIVVAYMDTSGPLPQIVVAFER